MLHSYQEKHLPEADIIGKKSTDRKPLLDALFGTSGLLACDDETQ